MLKKWIACRYTVDWDWIQIWIRIRAWIRIQTRDSGIRIQTRDPDSDPGSRFSPWIRIQTRDPNSDPGSGFRPGSGLAINYNWEPDRNHLIMKLVYLTQDPANVCGDFLATVF